ncbi:MAG: peptide chain release factor N(5)-glutamine methyltransferase [Holosporales bacterium]|nr:peptide chain release factor N(5)-glutamine methyltransferase [Holosporales bacterium]
MVDEVIAKKTKILIVKLYTLFRNQISDLSTEFKISRYDFLLLLSYVLNISYSDAFYKEKFLLNEKEYASIIKYANRRSRNEPIAKIINKKEFYGINFKTSRKTLDPRPETELIIDLFQKHFLNKDEHLHILDLGAGTGCIGLTILSLYQNAIADFADISKSALDITKYNAVNLSLINRCHLIKSNWFSNISKRYDAIVSNPPYVSKNYELDKEVMFDPKIALFSGIDGLNAYKKIIPHAKNFLTPNGKIFVEIGYEQKEKILAINKNLSLIEVEKDLAQIDRVMILGVK